jgi:hypothetical protein
MLQLEEIRLVNLSTKKKHRAYRIRYGGGRFVRFVAEKCNTDDIGNLLEMNEPGDGFDPCGNCMPECQPVSGE